MPNKISFFAFLLLFLVSCGKGERSSSVALTDGSSLSYASRITITHHPEGWDEACIINPWDTTAILQTVAMLPHGMAQLPSDIPSGAVVVKVPLANSLVETSVHIGLLEDLGAADAIGGVSDVDYIKSAYILERLKNGEVENCGAWMAPNIERIMKLQPDAILISPYQNGGTYGHITELGIPVIYVADYLEDLPLGRAEWIKYYGLLFGKKEIADSIFSSVETKYNKIKNLAAEKVKSDGAKKVVMDIPYSGTWQVPANGSINDTFIRDAGGDNPFSDLQGTQFISLSPEKVLHKAHDADAWIIRWNSGSPLSLKSLTEECSSAPYFKAFRDGNVWGCNTNEVFYFEESPFHPEFMLEDIYRIIHTKLDTDSLHYFSRMY